MPTDGRNVKRVVLVSGACGVGKSGAIRSMREALGDRVGEVAVLETDDFYAMIDPYWTRPATRVDWYDDLAGWLLRETALGFLRAGFDWVAIASNGHWREVRAREFVEPFAGEGVDAHHITLDPGDHETRRRLEAQGRAHPDGPTTDVDEGLRMLSDVRDGYGPWTYVIDNGRLTPVETARAIHEAVLAGAGRL